MTSTQILEQRSFYEDKLELLRDLFLEGNKSREILLQNRDKVIHLVRQYKALGDNPRYNFMASILENFLKQN